MLFYSLLGTILFITSGIFIIQSWDRAFRTRTRDLGIFTIFLLASLLLSSVHLILAMTKGVVSIINGVIFLMDTIFTFRQKK